MLQAFMAAVRMDTHTCEALQFECAQEALQSVSGTAAGHGWTIFSLSLHQAFCLEADYACRPGASVRQLERST